MKLEHTEKDTLRSAAKARAGDLPAVAKRSDEALLHELQIHQIELEMQNEALQQARAAMEESRDCYAKLFDFAPVGYVTLSRDVVVEVNLFAAELFGMVRSDLKNRRFDDFVASQDLDRWHRFVALAWQEGVARVRNIELLLRRPGGAPFPAQLQCAVDPDAAVRSVTSVNAVQTVRIAFTDVTERKRAEENLQLAKAEAERANNAKSRFLAAASHDLRQPLAALSLYVDTLEAQDVIAKAQMTSMKDCLIALNEMLSDLLDLSKLEAGVVTPNVSDFDLDALLSKLLSFHEPTLRLKGLALRCGKFGRVGRTDPMLFQRIVGNLISNAVRYTERGGVLVRCRRWQGKVWVEVWDTGIGIPADKTVEIFEEFKQLGNFERSRAKGTGLGLAIVAKIAALLGLQLRVRSRPGRGSVFAVELPLGEAVAEVPRPRTYTHQPLRIALVEDNPEVSMALSYCLRAFGHQVVVERSVPAILTELENVAPDIVIADYRLAGPDDGVEVIAALRANFGTHLPAMVITGDTDPAFIRHVSAAGILFRHKPLGIDILFDAIAELMNQGAQSPTLGNPPQAQGW